MEGHPRDHRPPHARRPRASGYAWEQDQRRQREAYARGDEFRTYTWHDVFDTPEQIMRELVELLR